MKLVSYRLKDRVHVQDLDQAGLIAPQIEAELPSQLPFDWMRFAPPSDRFVRRAHFRFSISRAQL
jgi:hypothetical protein